MPIRIQNGMGFRNGGPMPFKRSPNVGGKLVPEYIVLHDTGSGLNADGPINWLTSTQSKVSAHVVVARDGTITQLVPFNIKAWHAGQSIWKGRPLLNGFSIGLEIVNPGRLTRVSEGVYKGVGTYDTNRDPKLKVRQARTPAHGDGFWLEYSPEQVAAVTELCRAICAEYPIKEILTHWLISPGRKVDTNPLFPLEQVRAACAGLLVAAAPVAYVSLDHATGEPDESAGAMINEGGDDYAAPMGAPDRDESVGAVPFWKRAWHSRTVQSVVGTVTASIGGMISFLSDWRVMGIVCLTAIVLFGLYIAYRRSLVH